MRFGVLNLTVFHSFIAVTTTSARNDLAITCHAIKAKTASEILQLLLCARSNFERAQFLATQAEQKQ